MKRRRGRQHDEQRHEVGRRHADDRVELDSRKLPRRLGGRREKGLGRRILPLVLDLLRGLPKKQVGADRRAEHGHEHGEIASRPFDMWHDKVERHRRPGHADREHRSHVSEKGERQPAQHGSVTRVTHIHFHERDHDGESPYVQPLRARQDQSDGGAHRAEIRPEVDHVGDQEQAHERIEEPRRIMAPHVGGEAPACHPPDIGADHLDRAHQRVGEKQRPDQAVAELSASLRIGRNSARIVVGSAGDEAWTEDVGKPRPVRLLDLIGSRTIDRSQSQALSSCGERPPTLICSSGVRHPPRVDDCARPFLRPLLREVVAGADEYAMFVRAGEFLRVMGRARIHAIRAAIDRDGRNGDWRLSREPDSISSYRGSPALGASP